MSAMTTGAGGGCVPGVCPEPMLPEAWRVDRVIRETAETFTLALSRSGGGAPHVFRAGQFNMLYVFGVGEVAISISGNPLEPGPLLHTTRAVGSVTRAMQRLEVGDVLGVRGPYGTGWPVDAARGRDVLLVAGGLGMAPLRSVLLELMGRRGEFGRVVLLCGSRTPSDLIFRAEMKRWSARSDLDVCLTVDRAEGRWGGEVGLVTSLIGRAPFEPSNTVAFVCGPEAMMRSTVAELEHRGVASDRIHLSLERNMKCAVGFCGHCQFGAEFVCRDGPVFRSDRIASLLALEEL